MVLLIAAFLFAALVPMMLGRTTLDAIWMAVCVAFVAWRAWRDRPHSGL